MPRSSPGRAPRRTDKIIFMVPKGTTEYWVDNWVVPKSAEHPVAAHKWINCVLEPKTAGREMNYHRLSLASHGHREVSGEGSRQRSEHQHPELDARALRVLSSDSQVPPAGDRVYKEFKAA